MTSLQDVFGLSGRVALVTGSSRGIGAAIARGLAGAGATVIIDLPVPRPTSVAFGGDDMETLYITSARTRLPASTLSEAPLSGGLFACRPGWHGTPVTLFNPSTGLPA